MLTKDLLESKLKYRTVAHHGDCLYSSGRGNIDVVSDNVLSFYEHNLLPGDDGQLDGHYKIYVNINTFDYLIYKDSCYGSLTYTKKSDDNNWVTDLIEREKSMLESIIADKLLGSYYYQSDAINQKGRSLISDGKYEHAGNISNPNTIRWADGYKISLITNYRGYIWSDIKPNERSDKDLEAVKILDSSYEIKCAKSVSVMPIIDEKDVSIAYTDKVTIEGFEYHIPLNVEFEDGSASIYYIHRKKIGEYWHDFCILDSAKNRLNACNGMYVGEDQYIINIIPKFLKSL